jgi:hypothetical protein
MAVLEIDPSQTWMFRLGARLLRSIAALRILPIEPRLAPGRALLSATMGAPRLSKGLRATGNNP